MFQYKPSRGPGLTAFLTGWKASVITGLIIFTVFIFLSQMIHNQDKKNLENLLFRVLENRASDVENTINSFEAMASRMAKRFYMHKNFTYEDWIAEASMHFDNFPGTYGFINFDNNGKILWVYPEKNKKNIEELTGTSEKVKGKLKDIISQKSPLATTFPDEKKPFLLILSTNLKGTNVSGITGVLVDVKTAFNHYIPRGSSGLMLYYKGLELFKRGIKINDQQEKWKRRISFYNHGDNYIMEVWPGKQIIKMSDSTVVNLLLVAGAILGVLTTILMRILNRLYFSSRNLKQANYLLEQENIAKELININLRKLQRAAEQSPSGLIITDSSGVIEYVNPKISQITGYSSSELIGQKTNIFKSGVTSQDEYKRLWETVIAGEEWFGEFYNRKKDGSFYWAGTAITGIHNSEGVITNYISTQEDITKRKENEKKLHEHAFALEVAHNEKDLIISELNKIRGDLEISSRTDYLTGLLNRRGMDAEIEREEKRYSRSGKSFSFILSDIDFFKKINDKYGHDAGDFVLSETARLLKSLIRSQDVIARWGGEEFLIMLPETDLEGSSVLAEKIRSSIEESRYIFKNQLIAVTMSFGISEVGESFMTPEQCIRAADENLYRAKEEGRNRVIFKMLT